MKYFFILTLTLTGFFALQVQPAMAISWLNSVTSCNGTDCITVPYYNVTVNTDKFVYSPGENISLSSFMQVLYCSNSSPIYSLNASIAGDYETLANADVVSGGGGTHYSSGDLTAPAIPGNYDIDLTSCHFAWGLQCTSASISITVTGNDPDPDPDPVVTVPAAIISGTNCKISQGDTTCSGTLSWLISGATSPNVYNNNGTTYSSSVSGTDVPAILGYGLNTIYARDGGTSYATTDIITECEDGFSWVDGKCDVPSAPTAPAPIVRVSVAKDLIRSGEKAVATTEITAPYRASCTLYGASSGPVNFIHEGNVNSFHSYNHTTRPLTSAQILRVVCEPSPAISGVGSTPAEARVDVIPVVQEI